ncbi:MAG: hypothetical protein ACLQIB_41875 [Isosphaeraceae bacterium]
MVDHNWRGTGPEFSLDFRSVSLSLNVEHAHPGLELANGPGKARLLALEGLTQAGRCDPLAFGAHSLAGWDTARGRLAATYVPTGWGGLAIRATWAPMSGGDGIDLEIQAWADSTANLRDVEVGVSSEWARQDCDFSPALASRVESRDAQSAAHSYDGREPPAVLSSLTTLPMAASWASALGPVVAAVPGAGRPVHYVEMVQPDDVARRITGMPADQRTASQLVLSVRYGLLGHDIEKGVVLRARMRGQWIESESPQDEARELWRLFLREPLPLGP